MCVYIYIYIDLSIYIYLSIYLSLSLSLYIYIYIIPDRRIPDVADGMGAPDPNPTGIVNWCF